MEERYEIRGKVGQGGLGIVYRAYDLLKNRDVAIKRISKLNANPALDESTRQLLKEAGALASVRHPNIVTVHDVGVDEDGFYLVMEWLDGKTLEKMADQISFTWTDFVEMATQSQEALIAIHEHDLIHNEIKPSNFMVCWQPSGKFQMKMLDLGLITLVRARSKVESETLRAALGSFYFMPPEQFEQHPLDVRSDIYSMGCVYYHALTGIYPFNGKTGDEIMNSHLDHALKPIQELRPDIPRWACDWVMWMINRYPQDRPDSARQALSVFMLNYQNPAV